MAIQIETKDCTALTDAEMAEMADLCAEGPLSFEAGDISKQAQNWVLICQARESDKLRGFSFCTLERIGGTPSVIIGLASVRSTARRDAVLRALMTDQLYRALLAFPDEDVLVGARLAGVGAFDAFATLDDVVPRPDHKATGEERAWGRRLAKRFGHENGSYDDRAFLVTGDGSIPHVLHHESSKPDRIDAAVAAFFDQLDENRGDALIAFGWAMAEDLARLG